MHYDRAALGPTAEQARLPLLAPKGVVRCDVVAAARLPAAGRFRLRVCARRGVQRVSVTASEDA